MSDSLRVRGVSSLFERVTEHYVDHTPAVRGDLTARPEFVTDDCLYR